MTSVTPVMGRAGQTVGWSRSEKRRIAAIVGVIAALHLGGIVLYLAGQGEIAGASGLAGAGALAYVLGMRHAFDADHIAVIDDTTRAMMYRGRRPVGVGFFFAMGHSSVVVILALFIWWGAGAIDGGALASFTNAGGTVAAAVALLFLILVAALNSSVLRGLWMLWRESARGRHNVQGIEEQLAARGVVSRLLGSRGRSMITSSWHLYPVGLLMGLGLETASEVALLAMTASATSATGGVSLLAVLSLPLLFAAGMSTFDTADSLIMTRLYSWSHRDPLRTLFFNIATTTMTVIVAFIVALIYAAGLASHFMGWIWLEPVAALSEQFEVMGYLIAGIFLITWLVAALIWRRRHRNDLPEGTSVPGATRAVTVDYAESP